MADSEKKVEEEEVKESEEEKEPLNMKASFKKKLAKKDEELEKAKVAKTEQKVIRRLFKEIEPTVTVDVKDFKDGSIKIEKVKFTSNLNYQK